MFNGNSHGFTSEVLKKSADTFLNSLIDINHDRNCVVGSIVKVDIIEDETSPLTIRLVGVLDKQLLKDWGIEDLLDEDWSMECRYNQYLYCIGNKIYNPSDLPEIDKQFVDISQGSPVYDKLGNRVCLLLGGTDEKIDFNRCGLIIWGEGADPLAQTHLQVANRLNNNQSTKGDDKMPFIQYETEQQFNEAVAKIKEDYKKELKFDEINSQLETANASLKTANDTLATKETEITELSGKLQTAEASVTSEKERADTAESKLTEIATAKLVDERKQVLASKNYEADEDDAQFIATASQEDFDKFVKRIEKVQSATAKNLEAKASQLGEDAKQMFASLNLTGKQNDDTHEEPHVDLKNINVLV
jgi:hypothetical protein